MNSKKVLKMMVAVLIISCIWCGQAFADVGQILPKPELGWQRIDDSNTNIIYEGNWINLTNLPLHYNGTQHHFNAKDVGVNQSINFKFIGSKIRMIIDSNKALTRKGTIVIDGIKTDFNAYDPKDNMTGGILYKTVFEKLDLPFGIHEVKIYTDGTEPGDDKNCVLSLDAIDIDYNGKILDYNSLYLKIVSTENDIQLEWNAKDNCKYSIKRASDLNGPYTEIANELTVSTFLDKSVTSEKGYYYIVTALDNGVEIEKSNEVFGKLKSTNLILNIESEKIKIKKNDMVTTNIVIDNITEIAAEDIKIKFDSTKLKFVGVDEVDGIKLVKSIESNSKGEIRVILASKGDINIINDKKIILKLKFVGIQKGEATIEIVKGRVSDGIDMEKELTLLECGKVKILIEERSDVNNSGEYTLLDLGIDARHFGKLSATLPQYNADLDGNDIIDELDLIEIGKLMLENPNYSGNLN